MGKDKKKKGKGAAKTALKTEKKEAKKLRKELKVKGEDDIETLIAEFTKDDQRRTTASEEIVEPPSRRCNFTLCPHPDKEELYLFGGEFFNGNKTFMFNDLYNYNMKKNEWTLIKIPVSPPPRCAHQAVSISQGGGQIWIFGGEFASPTQSQFYHYKDFWVYHIKQKMWEKISAKNGPSARSGHRMCVMKRNIVVFGGFHDNLKDYKYYNDVHIFNLDTYEWTKLDSLENAPSPRSACQITCTNDSKIIIYGGYSKIKSKKDSDKGIVHSDMYMLQQDAKNAGKWKWTLVKQSGMKPNPRSGFSLISIGNNKAIMFGGVQDEEDDDNDEELYGNFFNDMYQLELDKGKWTKILLKGSDSSSLKQKKYRRKKKENQDNDEDDSPESEVNDDSDSCDENEIEKKVENMDLSPAQNEDEVFKVTIGPQPTSSKVEAVKDYSEKSVFMPHPRMNASLTFKHGILYLYGGSFEDGDKQITLKDFYSIDVHKFDEWKVIIKSEINQEWIDSDTEESESQEESDDEN